MNKINVRMLIPYRILNYSSDYDERSSVFLHTPAKFPGFLHFTYNNFFTFLCKFNFQHPEYSGYNQIFYSLLYEFQMVIVRT